jgi:hypothetical protein
VERRSEASILWLWMGSGEEVEVFGGELGEGRICPLRGGGVECLLLLSCKSAEISVVESINMS